MNIDVEFNVLFIERTMLIVLKDRPKAHGTKYMPTIVGRYDYDDDNLVMEIPPESERKIKDMCRNSFEAHQMNEALK